MDDTYTGPQRAEDDESNVPSENATTVSSVSDWLSTARVTLFEVGWKRVTTWMFMIAITLRMLCSCFSRSLSLGSG